MVIRSNGEPTYFAADIGYVTEKFSRGFDHLIYIWGADHHGTVARVRNAAEAMGYDQAAVEMLLTGWVRFVRDGAGDLDVASGPATFITLDELLAEIGVDAARWFFASRGADARHRLRHRAGQEAVEREPRLLRPVRARPDRVDPAQGGRRRASRPADGVGGPLAGEPEAALARAVVRLPEVVEDAAAAEETQGITAYATELATTFHAFYRDARVVDPASPERSAARLALVAATQDDPRERARAAGDLRARVDVAAAGGRAALSRRGRGRSRACADRGVVGRRGTASPGRPRRTDDQRVRPPERGDAVGAAAARTRSRRPGVPARCR